MKNFLKSIIVGIGGIVPGLSGSVLMIIFGLYNDVIKSLSSFYVDFKNKVKFLLPIGLGMLVGLILFSKVINYFLGSYEVYTRYLFLGLVLGTIPIFFKELKKDGISLKYYLLILIILIIGLLIFNINVNNITQIENPNLIEKIFLGFCISITAIVPGLDPTVFLSTLGLYNIYIDSLSSINFSILFPVSIGLIVGIILISKILSYLLNKFYTLTYSVIFGLFLSIIPNMLNKVCYKLFDIWCIIFIVVGIVISYYFSDIENNNKKIKKYFKFDK